MIIPGDNGCSWCSIKDNLRYYRNCLVWNQDVLPEHQEHFLAPRREAPQTSLLSKLNCREAWQSSAVNIFALQLSVKMQRFAASLKQQPLLQLKNECLKYFQFIFRLNPEPTLAFVRDLGDVLVRWWLGRTDTHAAAVSVTASREVLLCEDVLVEHAQAIKLQRLSK
eukprot:g43385.t1